MSHAHSRPCERRRLHASHPELPDSVALLLKKGLARKPEGRFATAREMALELEAALGVASPTEVASWLARTAREALALRAAVVAEVESASTPAPELGSKRAIEASAPVAALRDRATNSAAATEPQTAAMGPRADQRAQRRLAPRVAWLLAGVLLLLTTLVWLGRQRGGGSIAVTQTPPSLASASALPPVAPERAPITPTLSAVAAPGASSTAPTPLPALAPPPSPSPARPPRPNPPPVPTAGPAEGSSGLPTDRE